MIRAADDPRAVNVLAAFDRFVSSPYRNTRHVAPPSMFIDNVIDLAYSGWPDEAFRAVLVACLVNAPDEDLDDMAQRAAHEVAWLDGWEAQLAYEAEHGHAPLGRTPIDAAYHPEDTQHGAEAFAD